MARNQTEEEYIHSWGDFTDLARAQRVQASLDLFFCKLCGWGNAVPSIFVQSNNKRTQKGSGKGDKHD